jgi:hypothetical protein
MDKRDKETITNKRRKEGRTIAEHYTYTCTKASLSNSRALKG